MLMHISVCVLIRCREGHSSLRLREWNIVVWSSVGPWPVHNCCLVYPSTDSTFINVDTNCVDVFEVFFISGLVVFIVSFSHFHLLLWYFFRDIVEYRSDWRMGNSQSADLPSGGPVGYHVLKVRRILFSNSGMTHLYRNEWLCGRE